MVTERCPLRQWRLHSWQDGICCSNVTGIPSLMIRNATFWDCAISQSLGPHGGLDDNMFFVCCFQWMVTSFAGFSNSSPSSWENVMIYRYLRWSTYTGAPSLFSSPFPKDVKPLAGDHSGTADSLLEMDFSLAASPGVAPDMDASFNLGSLALIFLFHVSYLFLKQVFLQAALIRLWGSKNSLKPFSGQGDGCSYCRSKWIFKWCSSLPEQSGRLLTAPKNGCSAIPRSWFEPFFLFFTPSYVGRWSESTFFNIFF